MNLTLINAVAWLIWLVTIIMIHWKDYNYWIVLGLGVLAGIPVVLIAYKVFILK